ncbi:hypothetical protein ACFXOY_11295 [Streptomyces niveus]|uniref:hypothetical protein n=1 Tax=Streptomyces niveus TaxID=193462 RepID=UPI0036A4F941
MQRVSCRLQYALPADQARAMPRALQAAFDTGMRRLTVDPYGQGSTPVKAGVARREAGVSGVVLRYNSSAAVLMVTVVRVVCV